MIVIRRFSGMVVWMVQLKIQIETRLFTATSPSSAIKAQEFAYGRIKLLYSKASAGTTLDSKPDDSCKI